MVHLSPGGTAVLSVFLIMAIVCPLILIKFWGPKHGAYGRRGKREWDDDDQYDRRRRKKKNNRGAQGGAGSKRRRRKGEGLGGMEEGEMGNGSEMHMHTRYRPGGDWTSSAPAHPQPHPLVQPGQTYAGAYGLPPPGQGHGHGYGYGHGSPLPLGRSDDARGHYSALPTGTGIAPGTPPPATPAPRYTPGGYRAPSSQPHTPSGLRCASLPHLAEEEEAAAAAAAGERGVAYAPELGPIAGPYAPPRAGAGYQGPAPTSPPAQSHTSWLRKSSNALGRPLELVIGPARSHPRTRNDERMGSLGGGGDGGQVQQLGDWKKCVPLRPLEAVVAHPERAGEAKYLPPHTHTSQTSFVLPSKNGNQQPAGGGSYFALPALPTSQALFDPQTHYGPGGGQDLGPAPAPASGAGAVPGAGDAPART